MSDDTKTTTVFMDILKRENSKIREERAQRIAQGAKEAQIQLILNKKAAIDKLKSEQESMLDLSASPDTTVDNKLTDFDAQDFVSKYQHKSEKILTETLKYQAAVKTGKELFGIDIDKITE